MPTKGIVTEPLGIETDASGKPLIALTSASIYRSGDLIRLTESLLLKRF
jgi:hypothetical protein